MRLFTAINFDDSIKKALLATQHRLIEYCVKANFTREENLHLTLVFIGEVPGNTVDIVRQAMDSVIVSSFMLRLNGLYCFGDTRDYMRLFGRSDRRVDVWQVGVDKNSLLTELHGQLPKRLGQGGIRSDRCTYSPHLTLAREVILSNNFDHSDFLQKTSALDVWFKKISLMKSEQLAVPGSPQSRLVYTKIYAKKSIDR